MREFINEWRSFIRINESYSSEFAEIETIWERSGKNEEAFIEELQNQGFDLIGKGVTRVVLTKPDLPYVIKVYSLFEKDSGYMNTNKGEADIARGSYDNYIRDIMPKVFYSSENDEFIISEKLIPLESIDDMDIIYDVFETLADLEMFLRPVLREIGGDELQSHEMFTIGNFIKNLLKSHKKIDFIGSNWIQNIKDLLIKNLVDIITAPELEEYIHDEVTHDEIHLKVSDLINQDLDIGPDMRTLFTAFLTVQTQDIHHGNLALTTLDDPTYKDIRIIDFDYINFPQR